LFLNSRYKFISDNVHYSLQEINNTIKMKEELYKLKKEYDDLKLNMIQVYKYIHFLIHFIYQFNSYIYLILLNNKFIQIIC